MNFEDIVDMEWVDTTTPSAATAAAEDFNSSDYYFNHHTDFLLEQPITPPQQTAILEPEIKIEPLTSMPTIEQIKQLIEIAKRQLALREQQQNQQQQQQQQTDQVLFQTLPTTEIQTAAPSSIFAPPTINAGTTPSMPVLSPSTITSTDMTLMPPMNSAFETLQDVSPSLSKVADDKITAVRRSSLASMPEESISLEAYAEADGIDLKKLTPKERRQLRNKISARNFRVRRKEYISTLEGQVNEHKKAAEALKEKLMQAEDENKKLCKEMDSLKRQNQILQQQLSQKNNANPSSPRIPKPNLNKDISILGTKATDSYRQQDNCILVSNAVMPAWDYQAILSNKIEKPKETPDLMRHLAGQFLLSVVQLANSMPCETNRNDINLPPLLPEDRDFASSDEKKTPVTLSSSLSSYLPASSSYSSYSSLSSCSYMEELYDTLIQSALINSSNSDRSFWWWDNQSQAL